MRKVREIARGFADHPVVRERPQRAPPPARKRARRAPAKLTPGEIARGIALVRRAEVRHHENHPTRPLKQTEIIAALRRGVRRGGKPIAVSVSTWLRHVVRPALG